MADRSDLCVGVLPVCAPCVLSRARVSCIRFWSAGHNLELSSATNFNNLKNVCVSKILRYHRNSPIETAASEADQTSAFL